mmetsp:Transcript_10879/g.33607  ORF Transcript_10879/g.33607 Transcript_10879/m.33607 type:complete len:208 (-) Transcript_10879:37-660(-)
MGRCQLRAAAADVAERRRAAPLRPRAARPNSSHGRVRGEAVQDRGGGLAGHGPGLPSRESSRAMGGVPRRDCASASLRPSSAAGGHCRLRRSHCRLPGIRSVQRVCPLALPSVLPVPRHEVQLRVRPFSAARRHRCNNRCPSRPIIVESAQQCRRSGARTPGRASRVVSLQEKPERLLVSVSTKRWSWLAQSNRSDSMPGHIELPKC